MDTEVWYQLRVRELADDDHAGERLVADRLEEAALARAPEPPDEERTR
jgi:hypothetical protein